MAKLIILILCIIVGSGVFASNIYISLVDAVCWKSNPPDSLLAAREYFKAANPGNYFRIMMPLNLLLSIVLAVVCWQISPDVRWTAIAGFVCAVSVTVFTIKYFYPRNDIMFMQTPMNATAATKALKEWLSLDWIRTLLLAGEISAYVRVMFLLFKN